MTNQELQNIKNRYDIIGNDPALNEALEMALMVAPVDMTVLVTGESGVGKENIPKIIHQNSRRKNAKYFAVNCGAIPEGTVDSELFGHEKGAFTGATEMRKGYFEEADGGTLFLDEVAELPLASQARLLRVLQTGEFIRVGSSKVFKTDVRVIAATNVNLRHAVSKGKFREDLYYRLEAMTIMMPALRERPTDINLLFRKFASDFSSRYGMNRVVLTEEASILLRKYRWPGNVRQLKNVAERVSLEATRTNSDRCVIDAQLLSRYIPKEEPNLLPAKTSSWTESPEGANEREAIIRMLFKLKQEVDYLKEIVAKAGLDGASPAPVSAPALPPVQDLSSEWRQREQASEVVMPDEDPEEQDFTEDAASQNFSIREMSMDLMEKVLKKHNGNRKLAASELGISERTLYRKIKKVNQE